MGRAPPSLLYSGEAASQLDSAQLRSLGSSALLELEGLLSSAGRNAPLPAGTFAKIERTLISPAGDVASQPREMLTAAAVARLDRQLDALLRALSMVFLHRAALKALEYLIRIHNVHKHRAESLLAAILPPSKDCLHHFGCYSLGYSRWRRESNYDAERP